jgi:hypothetical protein
MIEWIKTNPEAFAAIVAAAIGLIDSILGLLPDKIVPYVGFFRRVLGLFAKK